MDRLEFLSRLTASVRRTDIGAVADAEAETSPAADPDAPARELVARFVERASAAGAVVARTATRREAEEAVARLIGERGWRRVVGLPDVPRSDEAGDPALADFGLELADWGVAGTGSLLLLSRAGGDRRHSLLPPATGFFVFEHRILATLGDALRQLGPGPDDLPSCCTFITGPSSTADIAGHHVVGVHGPVDVFVWVIAETDDVPARPIELPERHEP